MEVDNSCDLFTISYPREPWPIRDSTLRRKCWTVLREAGINTINTKLLEDSNIPGRWKPKSTNSPAQSTTGHQPSIQQLPPENSHERRLPLCRAIGHINKQT